MRGFLVACLLGLSCSSHEGTDPRKLVHTDQTEPEQDGGLVDVDADVSPCGEFCGETFLHELVAPKNLYFVIDRSGSMGALMPGSSLTRYQSARAVLGGLLRAIGHRVRYGAAAFPTTVNPEDCSPGSQVFPATLGALPTCEGKDDPTLISFMLKLGNLAPVGGTPTSATLRALGPTLRGLEGETSVVLVTDGAPNCNLGGRCAAADCTLNIEGATVGGRACDAALNCCDPDTTGPAAGGYCVDGDDTEAEISALAEEGIQTFVVGMPGAEPYAKLLGRLAEAGGTARDGAVPYYAVADADDLRTALFAIGTSVTIPCSIQLESAPDDPSLVNVYFDAQLVPFDGEDGWSWDGDRTVVVNGAACEGLESGDVLDARVVFGCDTVVR